MCDRNGTRAVSGLTMSRRLALVGVLVLLIHATVEVHQLLLFFALQGSWLKEL